MIDTHLKSDKKISEIPDIKSTILSELSQYNIIAISNIVTHKNKVNIITFVNLFPHLAINKIIMENVDKELAEELVIKHNSTILI